MQTSLLPGHTATPALLSRTRAVPVERVGGDGAADKQLRSVRGRHSYRKDFLPRQRMTAFEITDIKDADQYMVFKAKPGRLDPIYSACA